MFPLVALENSGYLVPVEVVSSVMVAYAVGNTQLGALVPFDCKTYPAVPADKNNVLPDAD